MDLFVYRFRIKETDFFRYIGVLKLNDVDDNSINIYNLEHMYRITNNCYIFDLQYGLFDNLSDVGTEYLDEILEQISKNEKKKYINKKLWNRYNVYKHYFCPDDVIGFSVIKEKITHGKKDFEFIDSTEEMQEVLDHLIIFDYEKCLLSIKSSDQIKEFILKEKPEFFTKEDLIEEKENISSIELTLEKLSKILKQKGLLEKLPKIPDLKVGFYEFRGLKISSKYESALLIDFLEMVFYLNSSLLVKKCEDCGKYFITNKSNEKNCKRIGKDSLNCSERADKIRRQHTRDEPIKKLEKKIRDKFRDKEGYIEFLEENRNKKIEFYGKNKEYILWLLEYIDPEKRNDVIKDITGLAKYLNDN